MLVLVGIQIPQSQLSKIILLKIYIKFGDQSFHLKKIFLKYKKNISWNLDLVSFVHISISFLSLFNKHNPKTQCGSFRRKKAQSKGPKVHQIQSQSHTLRSVTIKRATVSERERATNAFHRKKKRGNQQKSNGWTQNQIRSPAQVQIKSPFCHSQHSTLLPPLLLPYCFINPGHTSLSLSLSVPFLST